jgi:hypothetical protein
MRGRENLKQFAKTKRCFGLRTCARCGIVNLTQRGNPMRTPKGNRRRTGVKPGQGPATDPTDGTTARWAGVKAPPHQPRLTVRRKVVSFGS